MLPPLIQPGDALAALTLTTAAQLPLTQEETLIALALAVPCLAVVFFSLARITKALSLPLSQIAQTTPGDRLYRLRGRVRCPQTLTSRIDSSIGHYERLEFYEERQVGAVADLIRVGSLGDNHATNIAFADASGELPLLLHEMKEGLAIRSFDSVSNTLPAVIADAHQAFVAQRIANQGFADFPKIIVRESLVRLPEQLTLWARRERVTLPDGRQQDFLIAERFGDYESSLNLKINLAIVLVFGVPIFFIFLGLIGQIPPDTVRAVGEACWDLFTDILSEIFSSRRH